MLLTIGILPFQIVLFSLHQVSLLGRLCHGSLLALQVAVSYNLKSAVMLLLFCPQPLFFLSLFLHECLLDQLLITLLKRNLAAVSDWRSLEAF